MTPRRRQRLDRDGHVEALEPPRPVKAPAPAQTAEVALDQVERAPNPADGGHLDLYAVGPLGPSLILG